jgi:hypothetical protein
MRSGKLKTERLVAITGTTPGASAYLFSNQNPTAAMISTSMIRSTHKGNFTPHPFWDLARRLCSALPVGRRVERCGMAMLRLLDQPDQKRQILRPNGRP